MFTTLIQVDELAHEVSRTEFQNILVLDCRFDLSNPEYGRDAYANGHIPGAVYVHLDDVMSGPKTQLSGRHPLPDPTAFAQALASFGVNHDTQLVVYDDISGMFSARLWWLCRWIGHERVAVLDGGFTAWKNAGHEVTTVLPDPRPEGNIQARPDSQPTVSFEDVLALLDRDNDRLIVDARAPDRFRGENEAMDPVGGHIPGASNRFFKDNLDAEGRFRPAEALHREFASLLGNIDAARVINQCGSGVSACHNLLAMEIAGLKGAALYPGSWSEWCARPGAPVATGT